jgi:methylthioribose-1-phosphate isomerase
MLDTVRWRSAGDTPLPGKLRMIDQTQLPEACVFMETDQLDEIYDAIKRLVVRGAPAIGIAAAFGLTAAVQDSDAKTTAALLDTIQSKADHLATARPTAVNLAWALNRCISACRKHVDAPDSSDSVDALKDRLWQEADAILREDIEMCRRIGEFGVELLSPGCSVLTHCNAGALATGDFGTALSPIYVASERGMSPHVYADETRPLLQGSRLTAWELQRANVDVTTICDNMAGQLMREGKIDIVIVGADRIAANGDAANKIGTYSVAVLAQYHDIPFFVAAPYSTIDRSIASGDGIPIEQRAAEEISHGFGRKTAPDGVDIYNPAFDVTPAELIHGIITDRGILRPPYTQSIAALFE